MPFDPASIPRYHVPGDGPAPSRIMIVGEAPGIVENRDRIPFSGPSGIELRRYLRSAGLFRKECYVTNLCKLWPPQLPTGKQLPPSAADIERDEPELLLELECVRPEIIVSVGAISTRYFLGNERGLHTLHGIPHQARVLGRDVTILAAVHPAAGLHSSGEQVRIQWDFEQLGKLAYGRIPPHPPIDQFPEPQYSRVEDGEFSTFHFLNWLAGATELSIDTEGTIADPWCLTIARREGEALLIRADQPECLAAVSAHLNAPHGRLATIMHYAAHDIPVLAAMGVELPHGDRNRDNSQRLRDTMSELYLLGTEPKSLKAAEYRLAGMSADSYEDVTLEAEARIARTYLQGVLDAAICHTCFGLGKVPKLGKKGQPLKTLGKCAECVDGLHLPATPEEIELGADGVLKVHRPWSASRRLKKIIESGDFAAPDDSDDDEDDREEGEEGDEESDAPIGYAALRKRWEKMPDTQRAEIAEQYGYMPKVTLSDVADQERVTRYAARDADATLRIAHVLADRLPALSLLPVRQIDAEIIPMLSRMEQVGMLVDREHFRLLAAELEGELDRLRAELASIVGMGMNPNSPNVGNLLFRELGLPVIKLTKTKSRESLDDDVLGATRARLKSRIAAAGNSPDPIDEIALSIIEIVSEYREKQKLLTAYCRPILGKVRATGRIHTTLKYTHVATGRLSSAKPNLQVAPNPDNSPVWGRKIREGFVAAPGMKLLSADYSQIEMVLGACISNEPNMLRAFREGLDLHKFAANLMFDVPYDQVPKALRTQTKPLNFGAFYGLSGMGLQMQFGSMGIEKSQDECDDLIRRYYAAFPRVLEWKDELWRKGRETGYVETIFGRKRWTPGLRSEIPKVRAAAEREAANHPIQGSAQDIIRLGMREIWQHTLPMMWAEQIAIEPLNQIHDELIFEVAEEFAEIAAILVANAMKGVVSLAVPINVGTAIADQWALLK